MKKAAPRALRMECVNNKFTSAVERSSPLARPFFWVAKWASPAQEGRNSDVRESQGDVSWYYSQYFCPLAQEGFEGRHSGRQPARRGSERRRQHPLEIRRRVGIA